MTVLHFMFVQFGLVKKGVLESDLDINAGSVI